MTALFAGAAERLAPFAARYLGWRPDEFWQATPQEIALSLKDPDAAGAPGGITRADLESLLERESDG